MIGHEVAPTPSGGLGKVSRLHLAEVHDQAAWDSFVNAHRFGHPLQMWAWGELKKHNGWRPQRLWALDSAGRPLAGAQLLYRRIPRIGRSIAYVPRGPVANPDTASALLTELIEAARGQGALFLKIEPAWTEGKLAKGWRRGEPILLAETLTLDLSRSEDELLSAMKPKTRQYIRKGGKEGVEITKVTDLAGVDEFYRIYAESAKRLGFGIHIKPYYHACFEEFGDAGSLYLAHAGGRALATLWLVHSMGTSFELYGGVIDSGAERANYITKWRAITDMKARGVRTYDFNGRFNEGISRFKEGFGAAPTDFIASHDYPISEVGHFLWTKGLPLVKSIARVAS